ncbi:PREDICTED: poly [ADP-ribose] polymerase 14-like [Branchiostoma belcheri]|uniref:Poly [ADP-ribose] polymerase n=1 Tax=Branchiostoma belcheri TaxID=7741 RepID=A0A6P4ZCI0_BRABE|nr:PREDICTED: poly [ADP-ribose] polymerase 14-like [Branchiostoma belcheri]
MATPGLSIVVSGLPDFPTEETAKDKITLYFQNRSQSSGGDVKNVGVNTATRQAVVTFEEQSVAQNVLAQPVHTLNNTQVHVEPYPAGTDAVRIDQAGSVSSSEGGGPYTATQQPEQGLYSNLPQLGQYAYPSTPDTGIAAPQHPAVNPSQPPVNPSQPPVNPQQPPIGAHQPVVDPNQPPVYPQPQHADPHQPPVNPQQPPVNPNQHADPNQLYVDPYQPYFNPQQQPVNPQQPPAEPHMGYNPAYNPAMPGYMAYPAPGPYAAGPGQPPYPGYYGYPPYPAPGTNMPFPQHSTYYSSPGQHPDQNPPHYVWPTSESVVSSSTRKSHKSSAASTVSSRSAATRASSKISKRTSSSSVKPKAVSPSKSRRTENVGRSSTPPGSMVSESSTLVDDFESVSIRDRGSSKHSYVSSWLNSNAGAPTAGAAVENDCAILVSGFSSPPSKEYLELYFENKRKGGGETKDIQVRGKKAFVSFKDVAVHHKVLSRSHTISGVQVTVEEVPGSVMQLDKTRLLVKGFKDSTTEQLLGLYMESVCGHTRVNRVDYSTQPGVALVTLDRISNFDQILAKAKTRELEGKTLSIERVPVTDAILVTDLSDNVSEDLVKMYFESQRRSGGGPVSEVEMNPHRHMAVIHFKNPTTVNRVTSQSHKLNDTLITVKPYYECLGDFLDSEEEPADSVDPEAMDTSSPVPTVEAPPPARESTTVMEDADDSAGMQEIAKPELEAREKAPSVTEAVKLDRNKLKLLLLSDFAASHPEVDVKIDMEHKEVKLTGDDRAVMTAKLHVYETTQNPAEGRVIVSSGVAAFLKTEKGRMHFEGCLQGNHLKVAFVVEEEKVNLFALKSEDVEKAKGVMTQCVLESTIPFDADSADVLRSKEATSLFKNLQGKHLICIHLGKKNVWIVGPPHDVATVKDNIGTYISTNTIITVSVDTSEGCVKFLQEYKKDDISKVERQHTEQAVKITSRTTGGFSIRGTKDGTREAKKKLEKLVADVKKVSKKITKPGMHKFLTGETGRALLDVAGRENHCLIIPDVPSRGRGGAKTLCSHTTKHGKKLVVVHGDITRHTVDVIVNAANDTLRHGGGVAGAIARAAGPQIQQDCDKHVRDSGPLADGEVMTTKGYNLPCKMVVHAVGPQWSQDMSDVDKQVKEALLKQAVYKSMQAAKDNHSIAIPGISSGIYGYPMSLCAAAILDSVQSFFQVNNTCTLTEVHLIEMDSRKADAFQDEFVKRFGRDKLTIPGQGPGSKRGGAVSTGAANNILSGPGGVKILLKQGDITQEQVDVLVNTTGTNLALTGGGVNSAFGKAGGLQLQQLCNNHGQAKPGEVVVTQSAGRLSCSQVYHAVLFGMADRNPQEKLIFKCLSNASQSGHRSIAFPAIGTGNMGFRRDEVAKSMYDAILGFYYRNRACSVKDIRIIVFDQPTVKAFAKELKDRQEGRRTTPVAAVPTSGSGGKGTEIYSAVRKPQAGVQEMDMAAVTVQVRTGDITGERVDAIVNPTRNDLGLSGGMAKVVGGAAGPGLQRECQQYIMQNGNLRDGSVVVTGGHDLPCSNVLHLTSPNREDQLRGYVKKVLVVAEQKNMQSVAFPALGTGGFNIGPDKSAFCMLGGIADFVRDCSPASVKEVRITIFQQQMLQDFHTEMDRRAAMNGHGTSFFKKFARAFGFGSSDADNSSSRPSPAPRPAGNVSFPASTPKELTLLLFGPDQDRLDRARKAVDSIVVKNCQEQKIENPAVTMLTAQEARMIHTYGEDRDVVVKKGSGVDCLLIQGAIHDVTEVLKKIWTVLNAKVEEQRDLEKAHSVQKDAQWSYVVAQGREQKIHPAANAIIEAAYKAKKSSVKYDDDNEDCEIDFKAMRVTMKPSKRSFPVQRRDKRAEVGGGLPSTWDPQPQDRSTKKPKICHIVPLKSGSQEYSTVAGKFTNSLQGMKATVVSIERVQNPTLWTQYCAQRQKIGQINPRRKVEQELWHGTKSEVTVAITHNGFNRSYSGGNVGCWEGQGSYFALKAAYSTKDYYSVPDPATKHKKMFLCKVTTGEYTKGSQDMTKAPMRSDKPNVPFDSTVNDVNNPTVFVIFHDAQAYPEYLITFKMS